MEETNESIHALRKKISNQKLFLNFKTAWILLGNNHTHT